MNEPIDTIISVDGRPPTSIDTVYDTDDNIILVESDYLLLSDFPWLSFLKESAVLPLEREIYVFGISRTEDKFGVDVNVIDALGFYMINESAEVQFKQEAFAASWNKLPEELSWLYGSKPYITSSDMTPILQELRDAVNSGEASDDLYSYIDTHTYNQPIYQEEYGSYGAYFDNNMLVPHGNITQVRMKLGYKYDADKQSLDFVDNGDHITLSDPKHSYIEIIIQNRIGDSVSGQILSVLSNGSRYPQDIYITTDEVKSYFSAPVEDTLNIQLEITLLYNVTNRKPIFCMNPIVNVSRIASLSVLTSETGYVGTSSLELRTTTQVLPSGDDVGPLTTDVLLFDNEFIYIDTVEDSIMTAEYLVTLL